MLTYTSGNFPIEYVYSYWNLFVCFFLLLQPGANHKLLPFISYTFNRFRYVPTVFDNTTTEVNYKGQQILLQLWDTAGLYNWNFKLRQKLDHLTRTIFYAFLLPLSSKIGQEDYDRLRPLSYPGSDIVLLCYSCVSEASYEAIVEKVWFLSSFLYQRLC